MGSTAVITAADTRRHACLAQGTYHRGAVSGRVVRPTSIPRAIDRAPVRGGQRHLQPSPEDVACALAGKAVAELSLPLTVSSNSVSHSVPHSRIHRT